MDDVAYILIAGLCIQGILIFLGIRASATIAAKAVTHDAVQLENRITQIETVLRSEGKLK